MKSDDAAKLVKVLGGLFPGQLTQEQARLAAEQFRAHEYDDVLKAIKDHRVNGATKDGFIDWKNLYEGCRAASQASQGGGATREASWFDVYRRQRPQLRERGDAEVALRVHRDWWVRCGKSDSYRVQMETSCVSQLVSAGMTNDDAREWVVAVFDPSPDYFQRCLDELRQTATPVLSMAESPL